MFKKQGDKTINIALQCEKYNRYGMTQQRILILTDVAFYLISQKKIHSKMMVRTLHYVIKTIHAKSLELILCFVNEGGTSNYIDVRLSIPQRELFLEVLKNLYKSIAVAGMQGQQPRKYKVYGIPDKSLRDFRMGS